MSVKNRNSVSFLFGVTAVMFSCSAIDSRAQNVETFAQDGGYNRLEESKRAKARQIENDRIAEIEKFDKSKLKSVDTRESSGIYYAHDQMVDLAINRYSAALHNFGVDTIQGQALSAVIDSLSSLSRTYHLMDRRAGVSIVIGDLIETADRYLAEQTAG
ncbi:MAG: hypothetical protein LBJ89_04125 [Holosporales bacterium]|jgi:hypothetical protein|nr:hypothetical protein [Holosporales bacterium]